MAFEHLIKLPGAYKYSNLINDYRQPLNAVTGNNPKEKMKLFISIIPDGECKFIKYMYIINSF